MGRADHPSIAWSSLPIYYQTVVTVEMSVWVSNWLHVIATQVRYALRTEHNLDTLPHVERIDEFPDRMVITWQCPRWWRKA